MLAIPSEIWAFISSLPRSNDGLLHRTSQIRAKPSSLWKGFDFIRFSSRSGKSRSLATDAAEFYISSP